MHQLVKVLRITLLSKGLRVRGYWKGWGQQAPSPPFRESELCWKLLIILVHFGTSTSPNCQWFCTGVECYIFWL